MSKISVILRQTNVTNLKQTVYVKHTHKGSSFAKSTAVEIEPAMLLKSGKVSGKLTNAPELNEAISIVYNDMAKAARNIMGWDGIPDRVSMAKEFGAIVTNRINAKAAAPRIVKKLDSIIASLNESLAAAKAEVTRLEREIMEWELINGSYEGKLFVKFIDDYADEIALTKSKSTAASYRSVATDFKLYNPSLKFENVTPDTLDDYEKYLIKRQMNNVTIKTYVSKLKTVYRYYSVKQHVNPTALDTHKMKTKSLKETSIIYLTKTELQTLSELTFESKSVESVRDLLLFMCHTGLRYSDAFVTKEMIIGNFICLTTLKTHTYVEIPLSKTAQNILEKYDYQMPRYKLNYFNRVIKDICALIPSMLSDVAHRPAKCGTVTTANPMPRHKAITAHVGRKTFATHALANGVNPAVLKGWLGHSKLEMMLNHYASSQHNTAAEMDKVSVSML